MARNSASISRTARSCAKLLALFWFLQLQLIARDGQQLPAIIKQRRCDSASISNSIFHAENRGWGAEGRGAWVACLPGEGGGGSAGDKCAWFGMNAHRLKPQGNQFSAFYAKLARTQPINVSGWTDTLAHHRIPLPPVGHPPPKNNYNNEDKQRDCCRFRSINLQ